MNRNLEESVTDSKLSLQQKLATAEAATTTTITIIENMVIIVLLI